MTHARPGPARAWVDDPATGRGVRSRLGGPPSGEDEGRGQREQQARLEGDQRRHDDGGGIGRPQLTTAGWKWFTGAEPPSTRCVPAPPPAEAASWVALSGASVGLARLASVRFAAGQWVRRTGALPHGAEDVEVRL